MLVVASALAVALGWQVPCAPLRAASECRARSIGLQLPTERTGDTFLAVIDLGEGDGTVTHEFRPYFSSSALITMRYPVPHVLQAEPTQGVIKVTKSGDGLFEGDVLRAFSTLEMRYDSAKKEVRFGEGILGEATDREARRASFDGGAPDEAPRRPAFPSLSQLGGAVVRAINPEAKPRRCLYVSEGQPYQQVVDALVANTPEKTREIVLVFERPLQQPQEEEQEEEARRGEAAAAAAAQRAAAAAARRSILPRLQKEAAEAEAAAAAGAAVQGSGSATGARATGGAAYTSREPARGTSERARREVSRFVYLPGLQQVAARLNQTEGVARIATSRIRGTARAAPPAADEAGAPAKVDSAAAAGQPDACSVGDLVELISCATEAAAAAAGSDGNKLRITLNGLSRGSFQLTARGGRRDGAEGQTQLLFVTPAAGFRRSELVEELRALERALDFELCVDGKRRPARDSPRRR